LTKGLNIVAYCVTALRVTLILKRRE